MDSDEWEGSEDENPFKKKCLNAFKERSERGQAKWVRVCGVP